ncbi:MAG: hypothetical protein JWM64_806 [Frankiales bacterium]|nr:hypothetical protein [Frankiales bacterium]
MTPEQQFRGSTTREDRLEASHGGKTSVVAAPGTAQSSAENTAEDVQDSDAVDGLARVGLASRGLVWLVVGLLALSVLLGGDERADQQGALRAIADKPFGEVLLVVLVVGYLGFALWQALNAAVGDCPGKKRLGSAGKALLHLALAAGVVRFLVSGQQEGDPAPSLTARLMEHTGGRWLVGLAGLVALGVAGWLARRAVKGKHAKKIEAWKVPDGRARAVVRLGTAGFLGRALVLAVVGGFLLVAAVQEDPKEAKGLDAALHTLAGQPYGRVLLAVAVAGMLAYALWGFVEAAFHRHDDSAA